MANSRDLISSASHAYGMGKLTDALGLYRLGAQAALEEGNTADQHKCLFWQAHCLELLGQVSQPLAIYLEMRLLEEDRPDIRFSDHIMWIGRKHTLECIFSNPGQLNIIQDSFRDVECFSLGRSVPRHDLSVLHGDLAMARGMWRQALNYYETAFSLIEGSDGVSEIGFAPTASEAAVRLSKLKSAHDWIEAIRPRFGTNFSDVLIRALQYVTRIMLARATNDIEVLHRNLSSLNSVPSSIDAFREKRRMAEFWGALLDPETGDPAARDHPARRKLSRAPETSDNLIILFDYTLAILDYRLACLRYAVGLPPNDDQWHLAEVPPSLRPDDLEGALRRLARARTAAHGAMRRALHLDSAFECGWRKADVARRISAIEAIFKALGAS